MNFLFKLFPVLTWVLYLPGQAGAEPAVTISAVGAKSFLLQFSEHLKADLGRRIASGIADFSASDIALSRNHLDENNLLQLASGRPRLFRQ